MRTFVISMAAAAAALVVATPAAAQVYAPQGYGYGSNYGAPYGSAYGYGSNYGAPYGNAYGYRYGGQQWAQQVQQMRYDIRALSQRGLLTRREQSALNRDLRKVQHALYVYGRNGFTQREAWDMDRRIRGMQVAIARNANDRDTRWRRY